MRHHQRWLAVKTMRSPVKAVALATSLCAFISMASFAQDSAALNPELVSELYQDTKLLERRAARLAVNWREEVKLQLIRSRNRLEETSQNWLEGDDVTGAQFQAQFEEALLVAQSMGLIPIGCGAILICLCSSYEERIYANLVTYSSVPATVLMRR